MTLYEVVGSDKIESAYGSILAFRDGVPCDGTYEIRVQGRSGQSTAPVRPGIRRDEPQPSRSGSVWCRGTRRSGRCTIPADRAAPGRGGADGRAPVVYGPRLAGRRSYAAVHVPQRHDGRPQKVDAARAEVCRPVPRPVKGGIAEARLYAIQHGKLPQIQIHEVEMEGPVPGVVADRGTAGGTQHLGGHQCDGHSFRRSDPAAPD